MSEREELELWYAQNCSKEYNVHQESENYLRDDVGVLAMAAFKYTEQTQELTDGASHPLKAPRSYTLAGQAALMYRYLCIQKDTPPEKRLGTCPAGGYGVARHKQSRVALKWMRWVAQSENRTLQTAESPQGEYVVNGIGKVDGYDAHSNTIFEYNGCFVSIFFSSNIIVYDALF